MVASVDHCSLFSWLPGQSASGLLACLFLCSPPVLADDVGLSANAVNYIGKIHGLMARARVLDWQRLMAHYRNEHEPEKLARVNDFFNRMHFVTDQDQWGKGDYWATPLELLVTNGGDCEDVSIAKYFTLLEMGVPQERIRITYVNALNLDQAHMVLTYYAEPNSEPLVLDNLIDAIRPASQRQDLRAVYSFNGNGLWLLAEQGRGKRVGSSERISLWRDLALRMEKELAR